MFPPHSHWMYPYEDDPEPEEDPMSEPHREFRPADLPPAHASFASQPSTPDPVKLTPGDLADRAMVVWENVVDLSHFVKTGR